MRRILAAPIPMTAPLLPAAPAPELRIAAAALAILIAHPLAAVAAVACAAP